MIGLYLCRQRPTLPHTFACSNIGPAGLNFRVRDGNGWIPRGKITDKLRCVAGVNEPPSGGEWQPAAEVPSALCEGSPWHHLGVALSDKLSKILRPIPHN
jgi:hypothetical protein